MRPRVFITQPVAPRAIERLRAATDVELNPDPLRVLSKAELCEAVKRHDILFSLVQDFVDADVIAANPTLRMLATMTITPKDNIDVAAATARRIPITVIPALVTEATADVAFALLLAVGRRIVEGDRMVRAGTFPGAQSMVLEGGAVSGKTLGLVGVGKVGRAVARRARGFDMRILYHDPRRLPEVEERELGLIWVPFERVFAESDFVSVHAPLSDQTRHLVSAREFALMKPAAYFLNTSRGPIVDEKAMVRALQEKRIAGAALDVFENEPLVAPELLAMSNVVMVPHIGSAVSELREQMAHVVVDNILAVIDGRRPPNCWNPEIYG
ncbi:MAG: D-glycerate dehydrogenase [Alphaproteobacteria bacterium]|nr:D-glycerate dehydrogenase [Alphaproteobacteria bacterium]